MKSLELTIRLVVCPSNFTILLTVWFSQTWRRNDAFTHWNFAKDPCHACAARIGYVIAEFCSFRLPGCLISDTERSGLEEV
jgi:hypothetical protein